MRIVPGRWRKRGNPHTGQSGRRNSMRPWSLSICRPLAAISLTLAVAGATPLSAQSVHRMAHASIPTIRLDYFEASNGQLAGSLDPVQVTSFTDADTIMLTNANLIAIG